MVLLPSLLKKIIFPGFPQREECLFFCFSSHSIEVLLFCSFYKSWCCLCSSYLSSHPQQRHWRNSCNPMVFASLRVSFYSLNSCKLLKSRPVNPLVSERFQLNNMECKRRFAFSWIEHIIILSDTNFSHDFLMVLLFSFHYSLAPI